MTLFDLPAVRPDKPCIYCNQTGRWHHPTCRSYWPSLRAETRRLGLPCPAIWTPRG